MMYDDRLECIPEVDDRPIGLPVVRIALSVLDGRRKAVNVAQYAKLRQMICRGEYEDAMAELERLEEKARRRARREGMMAHEA